MKLVKDIDNNQNSKKISDKEAEEAFKTILAWMGEDPSREGLLEEVEDFVARVAVPLFVG